MQKRLVFHCSTFATAGMLVDGIRRTSRELARFALQHRVDAAFVLDVGLPDPLSIRQKWVFSIIDGEAVVDLSHLPDRWTTKRRLRHRVPYQLQQAIRWIQRPRLMLFSFFERLRLKGYFRSFAEAVQARIISSNLRKDLYSENGTRKAFLPWDLAVAERFEHRPGDVLILSGADWPDMVDRLLSFDEQSSPACVLLCYDIIPLLYPHFFTEKVVTTFRDSFHVLLARADLVIVTANQIAKDIRDYCKENQIPLRKTAVIKLGTVSYPKTLLRVDLPSPLQTEKFILFVSTIEPRKGHRLLLSVWRRLLAAGIPQLSGFKLVFVGRKGWLVDELISEIEADPAFGGTLLWLSNVGDTLLETLYSECAFCVYPSIYEGFGLPVIEAFRHDKAVISSDGGALAETAGEFAPCLDPLDEEAWYDRLKLWIEDSSERIRFENQIKQNFTTRSWDEVGADFFSAVDREIEPLNAPQT